MYTGQLLSVLFVLLCASSLATDSRRKTKTKLKYFDTGGKNIETADLINIDEKQNDAAQGSGYWDTEDDTLDSSSGAGPDDEDAAGESSGNGGVGNRGTRCETLRARRLEQPTIVGSFTPRCTPNGDFQLIQCLGSTGYCWCVDSKTGKEQPYTRKRGEVDISTCITDDPRTGQRKSEGDKQNLPQSEPVPGPEKSAKNDKQKTEDQKGYSSMPGIVGGALVGVFCAILLVLFIVYRMRKKDEGSYALDEPKNSPALHQYQKAPTREFYA
ncbi:uncharacterized protein LOC141909511 isoform X2 [Tubulanus polymorphus]|uniref:uncharacterized protein LOC141909511 isoform X2 n=1 Tax=Tubulanus polymorphus TaxID=672921 RepID=UPI003DA4D017